MENNKNRYIVVSYKDIHSYNVVGIDMKDSYNNIESLIPYIIYIYELDKFINIEYTFNFENNISAVNFLNSNFDKICKLVKEDLYFKEIIDGNEIYILDHYGVEFILNPSILDEIEKQKRCLKINYLLYEEEE